MRHDMQDFKGSRDYVASDELMRSVNIAVALEKPLLIMTLPSAWS